MGALYLASKLEECPIRMRDLINVYDLLLQRAAHERSAAAKARLGPTAAAVLSDFKYTPMSYFAQAFYDLKDALVVVEMQILKRLGFNVHVVLPYGTLVNYLRVLGLVNREEVSQRAWGYLNDAFVPLPCPFPSYNLTPLQATNTCLRSLSCPHHRQRSYPPDDSASAHSSSVQAAELLVGALRRGVGGRLECRWAYHEVVPPAERRGGCEADGLGN